jgi:GNAT superfamily N-acetyltransferase
MWRIANQEDDTAIVRMCLSLNEEDPGPEPVPPENMRRTLLTLRELPLRGHPLVLDVHGRPSGYALLIPFWSNELGGEVCMIDELYVQPEHRGQGHATRLIEDLAAGTLSFASKATALALEITPDNVRARRLYERLGFRARNLAMRRLLSR